MLLDTPDSKQFNTSLEDGKRRPLHRDRGTCEGMPGVAPKATTDLMRLASCFPSYFPHEYLTGILTTSSTCGKCLESLISPLLKFAFFQSEKLYNTIRTNISKAPSGSNAAQQFSRTSILPPSPNSKYLKAKLFGKILSKYLLLLPEFYILD